MSELRDEDIWIERKSSPQTFKQGSIFVTNNYEGTFSIKVMFFTLRFIVADAKTGTQIRYTQRGAKIILAKIKKRGTLFKRMILAHSPEQLLKDFALKDRGFANS